MTDRLVCLDIGPTLASQCRQATIDRKIPLRDLRDGSLCRGE